MCKQTLKTYFSLRNKGRRKEVKQTLGFAAQNPSAFLLIPQISLRNHLAPSQLMCPGWGSTQGPEAEELTYADWHITFSMPHGLVWRGKCG